ncbi:MAG: M15 family metallopeptidase, partial [Clostridiales bacterium]|nr:M15 family metallopeptidase [Clostridiales bacterium]
MLSSRDISLLRPDVAENCRILIALAKKAGRSVLVTETVRDDEYQAYLYAQGRTRPGSIITNSPVPTFHSVKAGLAFDVCQNVKGREYDDEGFWKVVGAIGKKIGFTWGGDWKSIVDKPHFQWDAGGKYTGSMILAGQYPPPMPRYQEDEEMTQE